MKAIIGMGGMGLVVLAGGIFLLPGMQGASLAQEVSAECAALANTPSIGPAPADLAARCAASQPIKGNLVPAPAGIFNHIAYGVDAVGSYDLAKLPLRDPAAEQLIAHFDAGSFVSGCDFDNSGFFEKLYCIDTYSPSDFYTLNTTDGTKNIIGQASTSGGETFTSLSMDPVSGVMYATATICAVSSSLYTINLQTGQASLVGPISAGSCIVSSGIDNDGNMYAVELVNKNLVRIDKATGAGTVVGPLGYNANFGQGMDFDERTGGCFLFAFNWDTFLAELRTCDTATGSTALVGQIGAGLRQISGAGITRMTWPKFRPATSGFKP